MPFLSRQRLSLKRVMRRGNQPKQDPPPMYRPIDDAELAAATSPLDSEISGSAPLQAKLAAVERARSLLADADTDGLPGIVVVGGQSSGKSSLLEGISGIALPRGEGMCTTCPHLQPRGHILHSIMHTS